MSNSRSLGIINLAIAAAFGLWAASTFIHGASDPSYGGRYLELVLAALLATSAVLNFNGMKAR